jgi:2,3-bisphosphoglycerate-independent phosphoglycerate mutase
VEAPDEAGHEGDPAMKVRAVEDFDKLVVGPMLHELAKMGEYRALVLPDHKTPLSIRTHSADPVPFAIRGTGVDGPGGEAFDERLLTRADLIFMQGHELLDFFFNY